MTLAELHERLLSWATAEAHQERLLQARRMVFEQYGEPHEEDKSFEQRLNGMLDFFLYDHRPAEDPRSMLERFVAEVGEALAPEDRAAYLALGATRHGLFEVRKLLPGLVRLRNVFTEEDQEVTERRQVAGLSKGDLLEARLLPHQGMLYFSGAFLYHPREARTKILARVKALRKLAGKNGRPDVEGFLATLSRMAFKLERYRNVRLESIYDFDAEARSATPRPFER